MTDESRNDDAENWQERAQSAEAALAAAHYKLNEKLIRAELKAEAVKAGMVDLDGLSFINFDEITLGKNGEVPQANALMVKLKRAKPWLFSQPASSSPAAHAPRPEPPRTRHANELSHEEWLSARAVLLRRR